MKKFYTRATNNEKVDQRHVPGLSSGCSWKLETWKLAKATTKMFLGPELTMTDTLVKMTLTNQLMVSLKMERCSNMEPS